MVALRSFLTAAVATIFLSWTINAQGLFETEDRATRSLASRQVATGNLCAQVDLTLLGIVIARGVCVCLANGVITPASVLTVTETIRANQGVLAPIINTVGGLTGATTRVISGLAPLVLQQGTTCTYPANSVPNQCGGCGYDCASGYFSCGAQCVVTGTTCISGVPSRKRDFSEEFTARCPVGYEACLLPGSSARSLLSFTGYECIKTASDLESCGGCVNPLPGRPTGEDCSAKPNANVSSCQAGRCVIDSCVRGFELVDGACVAKSKKLGGYWAALEDAGRIIVQAS